MMQKLPYFLLFVYVVFCGVLAIEPYNRDVWWVENLPIMSIVLVLVLTYRWYRFSNIAYVLMSIFIFIHTWGGYFTFERVPFDWVTNFFGFERNHYDRMGHFAVGFYAYAIAELLLKKRMVNTRWVLYLFPLFAVLSVAGLYEVVEWLYADYFNESAGPAFLGTQGDVWDAQKDIALDGLGGVVSMVLFYIVYWRKTRELRLPNDDE